ncbi:MAG TPA: cytochrome c maturation protein CcmE [Vicinamibacterales bacterium]|jgi:cytochrome c-type biogenesis protein CcmE|nr:cytochrome c maturation protein CcmE [Vicinamibacterales bacterium]
MTAKALKIVMTCVVLAAALGGLMYTTLAEGTEYYIHVDEVMQNPAAWQGKKLQLHGFVADLRQRPNTLDYKFDVQYNGKVIVARYTGVVPDTFKNASEVVLKGQLHPDGFAVEPNGVMAKCPSKYNPNTPRTAGS